MILLRSSFVLLVHYVDPIEDVGFRLVHCSNRGTKRVDNNGQLFVIVFNDGIDGLLIQFIGF